MVCGGGGGKLVGTDAVRGAAREGLHADGGIGEGAGVDGVGQQWK